MPLAERNQAHAIGTLLQPSQPFVSLQYLTYRWSGLEACRRASVAFAGAACVPTYTAEAHGVIICHHASLSVRQHGPKSWAVTNSQAERSGYVITSACHTHRTISYWNLYNLILFSPSVSACGTAASPRFLVDLVRPFSSIAAHLLPRNCCLTRIPDGRLPIVVSRKTTPTP